MRPSARNRLNFVLLVASFAAGQGTIFVAQSWLLANGRLALLAAFGTHFSFAIFSVLLVDLGAITVLARDTVRSTPDSDRMSIWRCYWQMTICRSGVAATMAVIAIYIALFWSDGFTSAYILSALPGIFLWAFNIVGILDGLRLSGLSGLTGAPPYLTSGLALLVAVDQDPVIAGLLLGGGLSLGYILALAGQMFALTTSGYQVQRAPITLAGVRETGRSGIGALLTTLPGQAYFRLQLVLSTAALGPATTAVFLYAKQTITAFAQLIGFLRRVEFPDLVSRLNAGTPTPIRTILSTQRVGTLLAAGCSAFAGLAGTFIWVHLPSPTSDAGFAIMVFAPSILTGALSISFIQGITGFGHYGRAASIMFVAVAISVALSGAWIGGIGLIALAIGDLALNAVVVLLATLVLGKHRPSSREQ